VKIEWNGNYNLRYFRTYRFSLQYGRQS
jgi:hypothetical protein